MSKIEKALNRALAERGTVATLPVSGKLTGSASVSLVASKARSPETIGRMADRERRLLGPEVLDQQRIIHQKNIGDHPAQLFRQLRAKILDKSKSQNGVVLVTGLRKESGSTFVALNLAAAFAYDAERTALVVDCDLKNPALHRLIPESPTKGLTDFLEHPSTDIGEIIHPVGIPRVRVIPSGSGADSEVDHFASLRMGGLLDSLRHRYAERFTILDGPPLSNVADTRSLSELADCVLVVARYAHSTVAQIEKGLGAISSSKLLGIVFNDEPRLPWAS